MPFHIRDPETDRLVRELARRKRIGLTEAVKSAVARELAGVPAETATDAERIGAFRERIAPVLAEVRRLPRSGQEADKAFYDSLYENG